MKLFMTFKSDKTSKKFGDDKRKKLKIYEINFLPIYIQKNLEKYKKLD